MDLRIHASWSLSTGQPPEVLAVLPASTVDVCTLHPGGCCCTGGTAQSKRGGPRSLPPRRLPRTISDPFSSSWKTRLSSPLLEPPSHTCFEFSPFGLNLPLELVYPPPPGRGHLSHAGDGLPRALRVPGGLGNEAAGASLSTSRTLTGTEPAPLQSPGFTLPQVGDSSSLGTRSQILTAQPQTSSRFRPPPCCPKPGISPEASQGLDREAKDAQVTSAEWPRWPRR